jgi:hypothetical protein
VVRENQNVDGVYFLLQGQAQVLRSAGEENYQEFPLKRYDFFGHGERMNLSILAFLLCQCVNFCLWLLNWLQLILK